MSETLFLPALAQDEHAYDWVKLAGRTPVYPGHGHRPAEPVTLWGIADEIAETITTPVDIVGVALGGIVGQYLLIRHPSKVRSAVLANTPSRVSDPAQLVARADEAVATGIATMSDALLARWFRASTIAAETPAVGYVRELLATITADGFAQMQRAMARTATEAELPGVHAPITLVQGADDPVGSGSVARIHGLLPQSRLCEIGGSHMIHLDNPDGFREVVVDHLRWVEAGAPGDRKDAADD